MTEPWQLAFVATYVCACLRVCVSPQRGLRKFHGHSLETLPHHPSLSHVLRSDSSLHVLFLFLPCCVRLKWTWGLGSACRATQSSSGQWLIALMRRKRFDMQHHFCPLEDTKAYSMYQASAVGHICWAQPTKKKCFYVIRREEITIKTSL